MAEGQHRDFDKVAASWDEKPQRRQLAAAVVAGIATTVPLNRGMQVLEYGCGTGLCGLQLAPRVGQLTAADTSKGMLDELRRKTAALGMDNVTPVLIPRHDWTLPVATFDLAFASMVLHHVKEIRPLLQHLLQSLKPGGFLALADLEEEGGAFHDDPAGVAHHGFNPRELMAWLEQLGFTGVSQRTVHTICKQRGRVEHTFPVFLLTAHKPH
jgi:ubiquinone/menaquinone biosynthesis C-methylase UbiE